MKMFNKLINIFINRTEKDRNINRKIKKQRINQLVL